MNRFKSVVSTTKIGSVLAKVTRNSYRDMDLDADIEISEGLMCTIEGCRLQSFLEELNSLINKYSI